jgi:phosphoribosylanthranilate isomerase
VLGVSVRIKICGVTSPEAVAAAVRAGAHALGFVFAESPRRVDVEQARALCRDLPAFVTRVAVFHHPSAEEVAQVCAAFAPDLVQSEVEGLEELDLPEATRLLPVFHDADDLLERVDRYLAAPHPAAGPAFILEGAGRGGRGVKADWSRAAALAGRVPLVLAGGLSATNVGEAIRVVRPYAVDVSSGVESAPGVKDPVRLDAFASAVRQAEGAD